MKLIKKNWKKNKHENEIFEKCSRCEKKRRLRSFLIREDLEIESILELIEIRKEEVGKTKREVKLCDR